MADRVAVYIDFDNIVISRYDQVHGKNTWRADKAMHASMATDEKLKQARVDIGAILEYATSFGTVAVRRAYADWSVEANASYRDQLVDNSVDLTQLFPVTQTKNGADIRLAVDVIDDLFRFDEITKVLIVAGDSDYIQMVTRCQRMGREVIGLGMRGSISEAFKNACDVFIVYDDVPDVPDYRPTVKEARPASTKASPRTNLDSASALLVRALEFLEKNGEEWQSNGAVKNQMTRLRSDFNEKSLEFSTFSKFLQSRADMGVIEINPAAEPNGRRVRLPEKN